MYQVRFNARAGRVHAVAAGFLASEETASFIAALQKSLAEASASGEPFDMLFDVTSAMPLAQNEAGRIKDFSELMVRKGVRRAALVSANPLVRLQARRVVEVDERVKIFSSLADAERYLRSG